MQASALPVSVHWPEGTDESYTIRGVTKGSVKQSGTYEIGEGRQYSIDGVGFKVQFAVVHGKVEPDALYDAPNWGVRFDDKTSTFSFVAVDVQVQVKNFDGNISVDSPTAGQPATSALTVKLVPGLHKLSYAGNPLAFDVGADGFVTLNADIKGITARRGIITLEGMPMQIDCDRPGWSIRAVAPPMAGPRATIHLLPGNYLFQSGARAPFSIDNQGKLSAHPEGPYLEAIDLRDPKGELLGKVELPDGEARLARRQQQESNEQSLRDSVLAATEKAAWKQDFKLDEKMKLIDFSEQQVDYPVELPADTEPGRLALLAFTPVNVRVIPCQFSGDRATISFRTDLPKGGSRLFRLVPTSTVPDNVPKTSLEPPTIQKTSDPGVALLGNGLLFVKVPGGQQNFPGGKPLAQVMAPIIGVARQNQPKTWTAAESFAAPDAVRVDSLEAKVVEAGPVFVIYQVDYQLSGGKRYSTRLELRAGETHLTVSEQVNGFTPENQTFLRLNYGEGMLDPDRRLVAAHLPYSGNYDRNISTDDRFRPWQRTMRWLDYDPKLDDSKVPRLDIRIGLFIPNTLGVVYATTFYREDGDDALLLSLNHPEQWKTYTRYTWTDFRSVDNLRFYKQDGRKYMETALAGEKRYWALGVIPRQDVVMRTLDKAPGGPEVFLANDLGLWNLNAEKDRTVDWPEKMDSLPPFDPVTANRPLGSSTRPMKFEDYRKQCLETGAARSILNFGNFYGQGIESREIPDFCRLYIVSRAGWTPEQREQARQTLVYLIDACEGDWFQPHHSMMSGHPNFVMDTKQNVAVGAATFPNHPKAKFWRDSFIKFFNEWLATYVHEGVPALNTRGGRWTESIACYWGQSLNGLLTAEKNLKVYDGTSLAENPRVIELIRWMRDAIMSPHDGVRLVPPQGAHSSSFEPGRLFRTDLFQLSSELSGGNAPLAQGMRWIETNGREGKRPDVRSALYADYGPVFHYDFGGAHESYAHMQNIYAVSYRWGYAGIVYYGAKGKIWSYNTSETNGDEFDWSQLSAFNVGGRGMDPTPTDQLLYDFDFAQFYRIQAPEGEPYHARGLMLLRDDYLVLADEVKDPAVEGTFNWVSVYDLPQIYQLKPGAAGTDGTSLDPQPPHPGNPDRKAKLRSFQGKGDFLTVVAPAPVTAAAASFGATVNGEYIYASHEVEDVTQGTATFTGNYGYARANQLALFQGTKIGLDGFVLSRDGGDFGVSAAAEKNQISGRIVGREGGKVLVVPPVGFDRARVGVSIDGQAVAHIVEGNAITFSVDIAQKDGLKNYKITF